jgi:hypothetical protein
MNSCADSSSFISGCTFFIFISLLIASSLDTSFIFNFKLFYIIFFLFIYLLLLSSLFLSKHIETEVLITIILHVRVILDGCAIWSVALRGKYLKC